MKTIEKLKREARLHYQNYLAATSHFDCGKHLAEHIRPDASQHRVKFNAVMDELKKIDASCPDKRL